MLLQSLLQSYGCAENTLVTRSVFLSHFESSEFCGRCSTEPRAVLHLLMLSTHLKLDIGNDYCRINLFHWTEFILYLRYLNHTFDFYYMREFAYWVFIRLYLRRLFTLRQLIHYNYVFQSIVILLQLRFLLLRGPSLFIIALQLYDLLRTLIRKGVRIV